MSRQPWPDADPRIAVIGVGSVLALAVLGLATAAGVSHLFDRAATPAVRLRPTSTPGPGLEVRGGGDLRQVRARGQAKITSYGWVDPGRTVARIPLDRAIQITTSRGWSEPEPAR